MQFACADHYDGYDMMMTVTNYDDNYKYDDDNRHNIYLWVGGN